MRLLLAPRQTFVKIVLNLGDWIVGAFGGVLPWDIVWQIFFFNLVVKYGVTLLSLPMIYLVPDRK